MMGPYEQYLREKEIAEPDPEPQAFGYGVDFPPMVTLFMAPLEQATERIGEEDDATR